MHPHVQAFFDRATATVSYLISDSETKAAAIVDPVLDFDPRTARVSSGSADALLAAVEAQALHLLYVLETHAHADHLSAADYIRRRTGAEIAIGAHIVEVQKVFIPVFEADDVGEDGRAFDHLLDEGDQLSLGRLSIRVLHTPGHTPADVTYLVGDAAFVGDTLFMPDYGTARTDFPGGDARTLYRSIHKLLALPPATRVFVGHDYLPEGRSEFRWETTIGDEMASNVQVRAGVPEVRRQTAGPGRDARRAGADPAVAAGQHPRRRAAATVAGRPGVFEAACQNCRPRDGRSRPARVLSS